MSEINKARYWMAVMYPENMVEDWQDKIDDILQLPFAYCIHDKDKDYASDQRKTHVHCIIVFPNTTTRKHAMSVFEMLSAPDKKALNTIQACISIRHSYDYLIHDTDRAKKDGKYQYSKDERITGNNFDIGAYEQIGIAEQKAMLRELEFLVRDNEIVNMMDLFEIVIDSLGEEYLDVFNDNIRKLEIITRGNWQRSYKGVSSEIEAKSAQKSAQNEPVIYCHSCGSTDLLRKGKTRSGAQRYQCRECGKYFQC